VDSGADISLVKSEKLLGTAEFEPKNRVNVESVDGSTIETHGSVELRVLEKGVSIPYSLQLVNKQVDLKGDGILGRDFLKAMQARICYREHVLHFQHKGIAVHKKLTFLPGSRLEPYRDRRVNKLTLQPRSEVIVQMPVSAGSQAQVGILGKAELVPGVYRAESLVTVDKGCIITSIMNTTAKEVELSNQEVDLEEIEDGDAVFLGTMTQGNEENDTKLSRGERVIEKLKDGLNEEEKKSLRELCFEYQDVFYIPGDKLSSTNAAKHIIHLEPGVAPINTRPYRLPESQKEEIDRQVKQLVEDGIVTSSEFPWNSPLLVVPKKTGTDGKPKWRMVVDFRKLNEKTIGDAYPLPDITEILDQLEQSKYFT
jgi:hypothetical protein